MCYIFLWLFYQIVTSSVCQYRVFPTLFGNSDVTWAFKATQITKDSTVFNRLFWLTTKKNLSSALLALCEGNPPSLTKASNTVSVSVGHETMVCAVCLSIFSWRHDGITRCQVTIQRISWYRDIKFRFDPSRIPVIIISLHTILTLLNTCNVSNLQNAYTGKMNCLWQ